MEAGNSNDKTKEQRFQEGLNKIIEILAVQGYELRLTDIIDCMNRLGCRDEKNHLFSYKTIRPYLGALKQEGAIIQNEKGITPGEGLWLKTIGNLVEEGRYRSVAAAVLTSVPLFKPVGETFYAFNDIKEFYRAILLAVFTDEQFADLDLVCHSGKRIKKFWGGKATPFLTLFNHPFLPDNMDRIKLSLRWKVLGYLLEDAQRTMTLVPEIMAYGNFLLAKYPGSDKEYRVLDHCLMKGNLELHHKLLSEFEEMESEHHLVQLGKSAFLAQKNEVALMFFKKVLATAEQAPREHPLLLKGDTLFFFAACPTGK